MFWTYRVTSCAWRRYRLHARSLRLISFRENQFPATFTVDEDVVLLKGSKESVFTLMHSMPLFLHNFLCVSTSCNKCTMTRLKVLSFRGIGTALFITYSNISKGFECRGTRTYPRAVSGVFWCYPPGFIEGNREIGG